jgi:uncharacterized protein YyaL (SSP411 family)
MAQPSPNRLFHEKSPYLLQHAYNPVDWYPWGDEAFREAKRLDKPVFLSIGYSTCVYMAVSQMLTGGGGWPLTIIMTPDKKPFYSATYIPKENRFNVVGMLDLVPQITNYWENQRERLMDIGDNIAASLGSGSSGGIEDIPVSVLDTGFILLNERYDEEHGGFGDAPKFPSPHNLLFLLRYWKRTGKEKALNMVENTLQKMVKGGVFDHVGYGFHRYSTDRKWLVPHFEKMLYDQAMLLMAYTETYQATGKEEYRETAEQIIAYVLRDLTSTYSGFYSAEDADSEGEEGKFYVWTVDELQNIAGDEGQEVLVYLGVKPEGNYLDEATKEKTGTNILHIVGDDPPENLEIIRNKLFEQREKRVRPLLDDKILTDWNGLMIAALSKAARAFQVSEYTEEAVKSANFILGNMWDGDELLHRYREGEAKIGGFLNDYAFTAWGLIELYQTTHEKRFLDAASRINEVMMALFAAPEGGFYFTSSEAETLLARRKELYDGAIPSGNSVAFMNLMRLSRLTGNTSLEEEAAKLSRSFSSSILGAPHVYSMLLSGLDFAFGPSTEVVVSGNTDDVSRIISQLDQRYLPNTVVHRYSEELATSVGYIAGMKPIDDPLVYVCTGFVCNLSTGDLEKVWEQLGEK